MKIKEKVAIVTGASGEVGKDITKKLAEENYKVALVGRKATKLKKVVDECNNKENLLAITGDITKENNVLNIIDQTVSTFGGIDILINNAGIINDPTQFHKTTEKQWNELINTNLIGTFRITKDVLPFMMKRKSGNIINISSILGIRAISGVPFSIYAVTKSGLITFTKHIAVEYGQYNIRCNCIAPSTIRSPMIEPYLKDKNAKKLLESSFPLKKIGDPSDISGAILYLCSDAGKWITGTTLRVDGGISAKQ